MTPSNDASATQRVVETLRAMVMRHQLAPGQPVRQEEVSEILGVSRGPLREALRNLETEGLIRHSRNQGYFVVRMSSDELRQVHLMRSLLETEVLRSIAPLAGHDVVMLRKANEAVARAAASDSVTELLAAHRHFHFMIFQRSPLTLLVQQIERFWNLSESVRVTHPWMPQIRARIVEEHLEMIEALAAHDLDQLVQIANRHRDYAMRGVLETLVARESLCVRDEPGLVMPTS